MTWPPPGLPPEATLRALGLDPGAVVSVEPVVGGLSGAGLARVRLATPAGDWLDAPRWRGARIVKEQAARTGWLALVTDDARVREVAFWQTGLAARLPRRIGLAVERWTPPDPPPLAPDEGYAGVYRGALLMRDVRGRLMRDPFRAPRGRMPMVVVEALDALTELHARFWESPALDDARLGLTTLHDTLLWLTPAAVEVAFASGLTEPYLWEARRGWEAFFRLAAPEDAATLQATLAQPARALAAIAHLPRTLIHGDVWGPNLGRLPSTRRAPRAGARVLLIDWALVAAAPSVWDPIAMCGAWHSLAPVTLLAAYRARLARRLRARGITLTGETWRLLVAAAWLKGALALGEAYGRAVEDAPSPPARARALARLRWWARRGAHAARTLESTSSP